MTKIILQADRWLYERFITSFYNVQHKIKPKTESKPTQRAALVGLKAAFLYAG